MSSIAKKIEIEKMQISVTRRDSGAEWLLLLHGLQSSQEIFSDLRQDPAFQNYSLLSLDLVGFGHSDKPISFPYDLIDQARVISKLLDVEKLEHFSVVGHSLGGMLGTLLMRTLPDKIDRLVSLEGNLAEKDCGMSLTVANLDFDSFKTFYPKMREDTKNLGGLSGPRRAAWMELIPDFAFYNTAKSIVHWARKHQLETIFETALHKKMLVTGEKSIFKSQPFENNRTKNCVIADAGHFMLLEKPQETLRVIRDFLKF